MRPKSAIDAGLGQYSSSPSSFLFFAVFSYIFCYYLSRYSYDPFLAILQVFFALPSYLAFLADVENKTSLL